jgi:ATP-dependent DNA ligase
MMRPAGNASSIFGITNAASSSRVPLSRSTSCSMIGQQVLAGDGPTVFEHVRNMGLEGVVSKRVEAPYRGGPSKTWLKAKNPASEAARREREEQWR